MSTLTRQNRIPDYKDYMNFVSGYRNGKKDENSPKINEQKCESFSSFLENSKNRKFEPVVAPIPVKNTPKKLVKTEVFIEINQHEENGVNIRKTIDNFENREKNDENREKNDENHGKGGVMSKRKLFENKSTESAGDMFCKSKINGFSQNKIKINENNEKTKENSVKRSDSENFKPKISPKAKTTFLQHKTEETITTKTNEERENNLKMNGVKKFNKLSEILQEKITKEQNMENITKIMIIPPQNATIHNGDKLDSKEEIIEIKTESVLNVQNSPPPPPPPPMPDFHANPPRKIVEKQKINKQIETTEVKSSTVNNTDRIVKKLAYTAMLDMYGAYHDKANSYVATLPKNRVKKENGLQKIIDNIAAQGGLEKLSGRSNPKQEND